MGGVGAYLQDGDAVGFGPHADPAGGQGLLAAEPGGVLVGAHDRALHARPPGARGRAVPHGGVERGDQLFGDAGGEVVVQDVRGLDQRPHPRDVDPRLAQRLQRGRHHRR